ncbi:hypothetical protein BN946_scf184833.g2 [Trametes cinnabarina]|uniref:Peptidase M14 domain-containing protein n=1 Tax=Pycnoporus cinnabarinus TaxID=5643 RepID=A0A060SNY9_PYCCI|nr:hypothetical protein BN946_scf184833.g2 [Trametes cinnabarina]
MFPISRVLLAAVLLVQTKVLLARPSARRSTPTEPDPSFAVTVTLGNKQYVNKGLVAFGLIPSNFTESTGDTLGGFGSAIALKRDSFTKNADGTFKGTIVAQPDRGFNIDGTIDYQARQHQIDFVLSPYYGDENLSFEDALETLKLTYRNTLLYTERESRKTTGLDALAVRPAEPLSRLLAIENPPVPIAPSNGHLAVDAEGLVLNADGTFWVSDEYGPYIYLMSPEGQLIETVQPPKAILPLVNGKLNFTSETDPTTGRAGNQGFEGLTVDASGKTLYALLQSATIQDGGSDQSTSRFTRLLAYDIADALLVRPRLIGEWVVPLPVSKKDNTRAASEVHLVGDGIFLVLARDGDGHGGDDAKSSYKQADLIDIKNATDIHGTQFDDPAHPIAINGTLDGSITPATYLSFVNLIDDTQLARFGVHNGKPVDQTLIDAKWESLALAPCFDAEFPDDFFLFTAADNDFISTHGVSLGKPFNAGLDVDNQFMVFRASDARVWQVGPSHVDIYFQQPDERLDLPVPEVGEVSSTRIEDLYFHTTGGDIGSLANSTYHAVYHPLYEIEDFMQEMASAYPNLVELVNLGHSSEGREMLAMRISKDDSELRKSSRLSTVKKAGFVLTGAQHAREWIATSTALYLAHALVADAAEEFSLSTWLNYFVSSFSGDFYVIPVPNPDGYVYTWESDRLWYKNRQNIGAGEACVGIDMNRSELGQCTARPERHRLNGLVSQGYKWKAKSKLPSFSDGTGQPYEAAGADPCSPWYPGHRPFEAHEVNNIANFITTLPSLKAFVDLRSYGQMLSTPFSYSCKKVPKDAEDQLEAALGAANAIKQVHGTEFTTGSLCQQLYKASGNVVDYMYAKAGIKFAYSVHLRDTGTVSVSVRIHLSHVVSWLLTPHRDAQYGFLLPAQWIRPVGEETASMIRFLAGFITGKGRGKGRGKGGGKKGVYDDPCEGIPGTNLLIRSASIV